MREQPTVERSLEVLSEAMAKATEDLSAAREIIDDERADIGSRNTSVTRGVIRDAERVIQKLRETDERLRDVVRDLRDRD